jgi:hypothetical protein
MNDTLIEVDSDKFNCFLVEVIPHHHKDADNFVAYLKARQLHKLDSFQKAYVNEVLENYYGLHYMAQNKKNYILSVTNKKLCAFFKLKYGL